jgi:molybdopterin/thiamine biosynthesis adenylyltransferase
MSETLTKPEFSRIGVAGVGGIGGYLVRNLFDYGARRSQFDFSGCSIDIYDNDVVDITNTLHQDFTEEDVGKYKVDVVADRCLSLVNPFKRFMEEKDFKNYDVIFSAVDSMTFRKSLYEYGFKHPELFWIDGRCSSRQVGLFHSKLGQKALEKHINDSKERTGCLLAYDKKAKTSHVTPQIIAGMMTQTFLNYLRQDLQLDPILVIV